MTNNSKETERAELHKTIWRIANDLRGSVDGWDFKSYVLGMLFYRFISENLTGYLNEQERRAGNAEFDYTTLSDKDAEFGRAETVREKGFYILPSELFANVRSKARQDANLNETLSRIFVDIEASAKGSDSEYDFKGLFDDLDVNSSKLGPTVARRNEKLVKLPDYTYYGIWTTETKSFISVEKAKKLAKVMASQIMRTQANARERKRAQLSGRMASIAFGDAAASLMSDLDKQHMDVASLHVRASELDTAAKYAIYALVTLIAALRDVINSLCDSAWAVNRAAQAGAAEVPAMKEFFQFAWADRQYVMRKRQWP